MVDLPLMERVTFLIPVHIFDYCDFLVLGPLGNSSSSSFIHSSSLS